jgi:hypothetical protein
MNSANVFRVGKDTVAKLFWEDSDEKLQIGLLSSYTRELEFWWIFTKCSEKNCTEFSG